MPSNDTENIYATQYGGEGEPIPATKISYDNTTSGLTADDIQEAVDEVALIAKGASEAVGDIEGVKGLYGIDDVQESITITADGVKSYSDLIDEMHTAIISAISELGNNELFSCDDVYVGGVMTFHPNNRTWYSKGTTAINTPFTASTAGATAGYVGMLLLAPAIKACHVWTLTTTGNTYKSWLSEVPAADTTIILYYHTMKKV